MNIQTEYTERSKGGASEAGYHFYGTHLTCPRKFYIQNIKGLKSKYVSKALTFGKIFHDVVELAYLGNGVLDLIDYGVYALEQSEPLYLKPEDYLEDLEYMPHMVKAWYKESFDPNIEVVEVEKQHTLRLEGGRKLTGRIDRVMMKNNQLVIEDTKTSKGQYASLMKSIKACEMGDQFTLYRLMIMQTYNLTYIPEVHIDSIVCKTYKYRGVEAQAAKIPLKQPTMENLDQVHKMYSGEVQRVSDKVMMLSDGIHPDLLFPRSSIQCQTYGCEFESICRSELTNVNLSDTLYIQPISKNLQMEVEQNMEEDK